jgi:hypothetical protein
VDLGDVLGQGQAWPLRPREPAVTCRGGAIQVDLDYRSSIRTNAALDDLGGPQGAERIDVHWCSKASTSSPSATVDEASTRPHRLEQLGVALVEADDRHGLVAYGGRAENAVR